MHFSIDFNVGSPICSYTPLVPLAEPTQPDTSTAELDGTCSTVASNLLQRGADKAPPPHS